MACNIKKKEINFSLKTLLKVTGVYKSTKNQKYSVSNIIVLTSIRTDLVGHQMVLTTFHHTPYQLHYHRQCMIFEQKDNIRAAVLLRDLICFYKDIDFGQCNVGKAAWLKPKQVILLNTAL